jgi:hypothetical protein
MSFRPLENPPTSATSHILSADSGGPSFQKQNNKWTLVGVHSVSEENAQGQVKEGYKEWDVRAADYIDWARKACTDAMDPKPEPAREKKNSGTSGGSSMHYDATNQELSFTPHHMVDTGYANDPILTADVKMPSVLLDGTLPDGNFFFESPLDERLTIADGSSTYLRAEIPFLMYKPDMNSFFGQLTEIALSGADPSQPFYDPTLVAPDSPWIAEMRDLLDPTSPDFDPDQKLWFTYNPSDDILGLTQGFTMDATTSSLGVDRIFGAVPVPEPNVTLLLGFAAAIASASRRLRGINYGPRRRARDYAATPTQAA